MRLEEVQAFSERAVEALDAEVRELNRRVEEVRRLLAAMEARLEGVVERLEEGEEGEEGVAG